MTLSASMVKELREKSGAGMMDCKKALVESNGNMDDAIDWLRKQGLSAIAKKSSRIAAEGLIGISTNGLQGAIVNPQLPIIAVVTPKSNEGDARLSHVSCAS